MMMAHEATLASVHKPGKHNIIADILSRDTHLDTKTLKFILYKLFPSQVPPSLAFGDLTELINSEISLLLQMHPKSKASPVPVIRSNVGTLLDGKDTCEILESTIHSWTELVQGTKTNLSADLQKLCDEITTGQQNSPYCELAQLAPSLGAYVRPFVRTFGTTLD